MEAKRRLASVVALILVNAVVMGCGVQPSTPSRTSAAEAPTATATGTSSPVLQPTVAPALLARCDAQQTAPATVNQAGDVLIFKPTAPLNYPAVRLPDQTPLKPLQVLAQNSNNAFKSAQYAGTTPVNPGGLTGSTRRFSFVATICNGSASQSYVVKSVSVRIASHTPYAGQLVTWPGCDGAFSRQHPNDAHTGGCGGGVATEEQVLATFASGAQAGTTVVATQTGFNDTMPNESITPLPFALAAGKELGFSVVVAVPDMAGTYAFSIGFQIDGASAAFGPPTDTFLAGPVAHTFTGAACNTPAMLAQIPPATTPETYYICPQ